MPRNTWRSCTGRNGKARRRRLLEGRGRVGRGSSGAGRRSRSPRCPMQHIIPPHPGPSNTEETPHGLDSQRQIAHPQHVPHKAQECRAPPAPAQGAHRESTPNNTKTTAPPQDSHRSRASQTARGQKLNQNSMRSAATQEANGSGAGQPPGWPTLKQKHTLRLQLRLRHHRHGQGHQSKRIGELQL